MTKQYDAIIIGAGVIGAPIAFELAKKGYKTLSIDKLPDAGEGSTAGSCAIVRAHYSTEDGVAMAYEGFKYWLDWENYLEHVDDEKGLAKYMNTGSILIKSQGHDWRKVQKHYDAVGVQYEEWSNEKVKEMVPVYDMHEFWPVRRPEDPEFFAEPTKMLEGALFCPEGGYVNDPVLSAHNIMRAAEARGAEFMFNAEVVDIRSQDNQVLGVTLKDGTQIDAPVVINAIGFVPESQDDPRWSSMQSVLDDLGRYGAKVGAFLAAETGSEPGETLANILDGAADAFIAVALNPGQLIINRHDVRQAIVALKERIQIVCAVDAVLDLAAGRGLSVPLGQGTADFPELIGLLEDIQYRGRFVVGRPESTLDELIQGIEYLKNL